MSHLQKFIQNFDDSYPYKPTHCRTDCKNLKFKNLIFFFLGRFQKVPVRNIRASCHVSWAGKVDTTRQEAFTDCLAGLGERRRRISSFTDIGEQSHWWTLAYLEGNYYVHFSYSFSPHPPGPHGRTIAPFSTVAPPANITGATHMAGGP